MKPTLSRRSLLAGAAAFVAALPTVALGQLETGVRRGFVDAADFGVFPDGSDQSGNLQRAIDAAAGAGLPVFIAGGSYLIGDVRLPSAATIFGLRGGTVLTAPGDVPVFTGSGADAIALRDLDFDGAGAGGETLLGFRDCTRLAIERVGLARGRADGLGLERVSGRVADCTISGFGDNGIFALDSAGLTIEANRIRDCGNGGVRVWASAEGAGSDGTVVAGNDIADIRWDAGGNGQNGNGINVFRAEGVSVLDNRLARCAFSAVRLNATNNTVISGNLCLDSGEVAIFSEFGFSGSVITGNIVDGAAQGISITNFDHGGRLATCAGNIVRNIAPASRVNPDTIPIGIAVEADVAVSGNTIENAPGAGILAGWGPFLRDVVLDGNLIRETDYGIAVSVAEGAGSVILSANLISGARRAGIAGFAWLDLVSDDLARDAARFPSLTLSGNRVS